MEHWNWKMMAVTSVIAAAIVGIMYYAKKPNDINTKTKLYPTPKEPENVSKPSNAKAKRSGKFDPKAIITKGAFEKPESLPEVEQMGEITIEELNKYDCNNADRRCICLFGTVFDVTSAIDKYGPEGSYKDFAGHDITLCLGSGKLDTRWLDRFVVMSEKHIEGANGWVTFYEARYAKCGTLKKWKEDQSKWETLSDEELEALNAECIIM